MQPTSGKPPRAKLEVNKPREREVLPACLSSEKDSSTWKSKHSIHRQVRSLPHTSVMEGVPRLFDKEAIKGEPHTVPKVTATRHPGKTPE